MTVIALHANSASALSALGNGATHQSSQMLVVQGYVLSALEQLDVNFSGFDNLKKYQTQINSSLATAQDHSHYFLNTLQPGMIGQLAGIVSYINLQNAAANGITPQTSKSDTLKVLQAIKEQATDYHVSAKKLVTHVDNFRTSLSDDAANFASVVSNLNAAVSGDKGVLASLENQLKDIDHKIDTAIAGSVVSGLAILGGALLIGIGVIAEFETAGLSTGLVIGGAALLAGGAAGEAGSALALASLYKQKNAILTKELQLKAEVKLASGISSGYQNLSNSAANAATASQQMANAWDELDDHLGNLITSVDQGTLSSGALQKLFLIAAQGDAKDVLQDVKRIEQQISGATRFGNAQDNISETLTNEAQKLKAQGDTVSV